LKQFILENRPDKNGLVRLSGDDYHYLVRVRRLKKGAVFPVLNGTIPGELTVLSTGDRVLTGTFSETRKSGLTKKTAHKLS
jgi:16S rRNA (uracil1498-N3)-methyltransferase